MFKPVHAIGMVAATVQITATCPSCAARGVFDCAGVQAVPPKVAAVLGLTAIALWHCTNCHTTISEPELQDITPSQ
ncbi:MAG: hypothetical protein ACOYL5_06385 [Phototrophicaceae bacterium]|jgi:hypothetical protein